MANLDKQCDPKSFETELSGKHRWIQFEPYPDGLHCIPYTACFMHHAVHRINKPSPIVVPTHHSQVSPAPSQSSLVSSIKSTRNLQNPEPTWISNHNPAHLLSLWWNPLTCSNLYHHQYRHRVTILIIPNTRSRHTYYPFGIDRALQRHWWAWAGSAVAFTHTYPRQDSSGISGLVFSIFDVIVSLGESVGA